MFTAIAEMDRVLKVENEVAQDLRNYVIQEEKRLDHLKKLATEWESHSAEALKNPELYLSNPINAFLLIKRFTFDWENQLNHNIKHSVIEADFMEKINSKTTHFPTHEDLSGAIKALLRLQDVYDLSSEQLVEGTVTGFSKSSRLTVEDCKLLGITSYTRGDYYHSILWLNEAIRLLDEEMEVSLGGIRSRLDVLDYLAYSYFQQGNVRRALNLTIDYLKLDSHNSRLQGNLHLYSQMADPSSPSSKLPHPAHLPYDHNPRPNDGGTISTGQEFDDYERLCRGLKTQEIHNKHLLTCTYKRHHPLLYFRPAFEEKVNFEPPMYVYHGLMNYQQMVNIRTIGRPKLDRSVVYQKTAGTEYTPQDYRISKTGWVLDSEHKSVKQFSIRASAVSNLTLESAEELQVLNYGIGGHYEPHYDFSTNRSPSEYEKIRGNRIATFICYLSDILAGGGTVFPSLGIAFTPIKGNCVLWYNLHKSGDGDMSTRHAACPVLAGIKWASNKWFRERGQEFIRPCSIAQYSDM